MRGADRIRFRGTPRVLEAAVESATGVAGAHPVHVDSLTAGARGPVEGIAVTAGADPIVRLSLPSGTPPGTYRGLIEFDGAERPVELVVEPEVMLRLLPARLVFEANPGERVPFELSLVNVGNVAAEIRGAYAFGVFDVAGSERAIGKMVSGDATTEQRRVDVFADAVAEEHGGLVRVKIDSGSGPIAPGATTDLNVTIHVPDRIRPGHTYWGTWPLHNLRYYVRITGRPAGERRHEAQS